MYTPQISMDKRNHETTDDLDVEVASSSKRVCVKRKQAFLACYSKEWPCLVAARQSRHAVHCSICKLDFSCAHGGRNDCERHVKSKSHKNVASAVDGKTQNIATMFKTSMDSSKHKLAQQITQAEAKMCQLICDSNLSLSTADRLSKDFKLMFPDSKIAQGKKCILQHFLCIFVSCLCVYFQNKSSVSKLKYFSNFKFCFLNFRLPNFVLVFCLLFCGHIDNLNIFI